MDTSVKQEWELLILLSCDIWKQYGMCTMYINVYKMCKNVYKIINKEKESTRNSGGTQYDRSHLIE